MLTGFTWFLFLERLCKGFANCTTASPSSTSRWDALGDAALTASNAKGRHCLRELLSCWKKLLLQHLEALAQANVGREIGERSLRCDLQSHLPLVPHLLSPYTQWINGLGLTWASDIPAKSYYSRNCHTYVQIQTQDLIFVLARKILLSKNTWERVQDGGKRHHRYEGK